MGIPIKLVDAVRSLTPDNVCFSFDDNNIIEWDTQNTGTTEPTEAEIDAEIIRLQAEYDAQEYARNRQTEYPTIEECVHAILDNDNNELDTLQAKRAEIKLKYPKGG